MSRFYQVLKEASRWPQNANGHSAEGRQEAEAVPHFEIPPPAAEPETVSASAPTAAAATPEADALSSVAGAFCTPSSSQKEVLGSPVPLRLDERARLIPHLAKPAVVENYRRLRTKILQEQGKKPFRTLIVTSPGPQEGKTVTVLNLAISFAMLPSFKVLVIDGDLRKGTLGDWLCLGNRPGLSNLIAGSASLDQVLLKSEDLPMHFIVRGDADIPPAELLHLAQLTSHFRRISEQFDLVLVDSPPVNLITDAQLLAASCDAVLLVARAFSTTRKALEKAVQDLLPFRVIGTVLNAGTQPLSRRYYKYYQGES